MKTDLTIDARKISKDLTISVQVKNMFWVRVGMVFLRIGCWIGGFSFVDEFPMSLIQPDRPIIDGEEMSENHHLMRKP